MTVDSTAFVEVIDTRTGYRQRVPAIWIDDPVLGRFIEKTPAQRALDGELGQAPTEDSTVEEIRKFADVAGIDLSGLRKKDELLDAVRAVVGTEALPEPHADQDVDVVTPAVDPVVDPAANAANDPAAASAAGGTTETPAAGAKE